MDSVRSPIICLFGQSGISYTVDSPQKVTSGKGDNEVETFGLTVGLPFGLVIIGMSALLSLYSTYLREEQLSAEVLLFVHRLGLACVGAPTVLVTLLVAASFAHSTATVLAAVANSLAMTAVVPGIAWSAKGRPGRCSGYFQAPGPYRPHRSW